jgi:nucleotide-binding universal stress UspA family protein
MKTKILIPVDFTKTSFSAYVYGNQLAKHIGADITLIHILQGSFSTADTYFIDTLESTEKLANKRLEYFAKEYPKEMGYTMHPVSTTYELRYGIPGFTVTDYAADNAFDYIVAGTRDNHNIIERVLGNTSKIMAKTTKTPIIFVHENTRFQVPEKVVFAIDNHSDFDECIDHYVDFNKHFHAKTTFIHISKEKPTLEQTKSAILKEIFDNKYPEFSFDIKSIQGSEIAQSIIDFSIFEKADILTVVHRKKGLFSELFETSISFKTMEGIHLPILWLIENPGKKIITESEN